MSIIDVKQPLRGVWKARFQDVASLNEYAKNNPIDISNSKIDNVNIDGAIIKSGKIENTDWNKVSIKHAVLSNTVFKSGILEHVDFSNSTLSNVTFEDVKLRGVLFYGATLKDVKFVNSTFNGVAVDQTHDSNIEVLNSKAISSSFSEGQLIAVFRHCKLFDGVEITDLTPPSSLTFDNTKLIKVSTERSKLQDLVINDTEFDSIFDVGSAENITVKNSVLDTSFSATKIGELSISDTTIKNLSALRSKVKSVSLVNCSEMNNFGMFQSTVGSIKFDHCVINDFRPIEAKIGDLEINNTTITNSTFEDLNAKTASFENVTFMGHVNFTNAHILDLKTKNITKQPGLKLITDGSNVKF